jgi:hypothetical protein
MSANTLTSTTGTVAGSDPTFTVTYNSNSSSKVAVYIKYTKGGENSLTVTFGTINKIISATDVYQDLGISTTSLAAYSAVFTASGNYRVLYPTMDTEKKLVVTGVFAAGNQGGVAVINFLEP